MVSRATLRRFAGGTAPSVRMLCSRSASLIRMMRTSRAIASSILRKFSAWATSADWNSILSSLETPSTSSATGLPKVSEISSLVTEVSSVTSCSSAAISVWPSRCQSARISATASGCEMYGSPDWRGGGGGARGGRERRRDVRVARLAGLAGVGGFREAVRLGKPRHVLRLEIAEAALLESRDYRSRHDG